MARTTRLPRQRTAHARARSTLWFAAPSMCLDPSQDVQCVLVMASTYIWAAEFLDGFACVLSHGDGWLDCPHRHSIRIQAAALMRKRMVACRACRRSVSGPTTNTAVLCHRSWNIHRVIIDTSQGMKDIWQDERRAASRFNPNFHYPMRLPSHSRIAFAIHCIT